MYGPKVSTQSWAEPTNVASNMFLGHIEGSESKTTLLRFINLAILCHLLVT